MPTVASLPGGEDTIVAVATAPGRGAVAVVRLSGARAISIAGALGVPPLAPRRMTRVRLVAPREAVPDPAADALDDALDDALVAVFPGPRSYTGEDVVEFHLHGGAVVPAAVMAAGGGGGGGR